VRIGVAGPYVEAREGALLGELEANPRFAPYIQRRIGESLALLTSNVDLTSLTKELRKAGYSVSAAGTDKVQLTAHGAQLTVTRPELEELYAAVRAATKLAREVDPDFDLSALAALEETLALELTRREDTAAPARARELESLVEKLLRARGKGAKPKPESSAEARDSEDIRALLLAAVENQIPMEIEYDGFQGVTRRTVEPSSFDGRYLTGFCRLRHDQRVFNTARILSAKLVT
jgi:predicted DNA-binding transcriptional regulator YafY